MSNDADRVPPIARDFVPVAGDYAGWTVHIQPIAPDGTDEEGFLVLMGRGSEAYDDWVADLTSLEGWLRETGTAWTPDAS